MGAGFVLGLIGIVLVIGLGVLIGAVLLRASVSLANKVLPADGGSGRDSFPTDLQQETFASATADPSNPFSSPMSAAVPVVQNAGHGVPVPAFGKACGVVFVNGIATMIIGGILNTAFSRSPDLAIVGTLLNFAVGFVVTSLIYSALLPTSFARAALVYLFTILIVFAIVVVLLAGIFAFSAALG